MRLPKTAYAFEPTHPELTADQKRQAIRWWQQHTPYSRLTCPTCKSVLAPADRESVLVCPQVWCHYHTDEIPWVVYALWHESGKTPV